MGGVHRGAAPTRAPWRAAAAAPCRSRPRRTGTLAHAVGDILVRRALARCLALGVCGTYLGFYGAGLVGGLSVQAQAQASYVEGLASVLQAASLPSRIAILARACCLSCYLCCSPTPPPITHRFSTPVAPASLQTQ